MSSRAQKVVECCRVLANFSEEPGQLTRTFLSPPMNDVHRVLREWMQNFGMTSTVDAAGNLRGIMHAEGPRLLIGSHLDTVPNAGAFDGVLGVVLGVALAEISSRKQHRHSIEVIGFSDEEGVRFGVPFIGSRALVGTLDSAAACTFGLDPDKIPQARFDPASAAYLEFHIEQGPVLESLNLPLAVVDAIAGQSRFVFTFTGQANHAGTTPMPLRRDALAAAAEWILAVERQSGTVGQIEAQPNATNVVPGQVTVTLDVRNRCDERRLTAVRELVSAAEEIAARRHLSVRYEERLDQPAVPMDPALSRRLADAVERAGYPVRHITSGAGHDAMVVAPHLPTAMLFLRSPGGISHSPDESVLLEDVEAALAVGEEFLCLT